jgi:hypothetical protein
VIRPLVPRTFTSLSEAEEQNGQSRIYLGIHWNFDKTTGSNRAGRSLATFSRTRFGNRVGSDPAWLSDAGSDRQL